MKFSESLMDAAKKVALQELIIEQVSLVNTANKSVEESVKLNAIYKLELEYLYELQKNYRHILSIEQVSWE